MTDNILPIDRLLATALRGEAAGWPLAWGNGPNAVQMIERIGYHGVAGLLADRAGAMADWPLPILAWTREQGLALAMWELRHREVLRILLAALAEKKIVALLLKGTAVAYDLYSSPAARARGDSDLLVAPANLDATRSVLTGLGYRCQPLDEGIADDLALQEVWSQTCGAGTQHHIDLHWQLLNAPALRGVLDFASCAAVPRPLPRLCSEAMAMNRVLTLLHTCVHRAMHLTSPYFVNGRTYYGGDRLIWAKDIDLLSGALSQSEWGSFTRAALTQGVALVCLDGLQMAERTLGTFVPAEAVRSLASAGKESASNYLLGARQMGRAWQDVRAIPGLKRKMAYISARALPSEDFMRAKYPSQTRRPLPWLHLRRVIGLFRKRP